MIKTPAQVVVAHGRTVEGLDGRTGEPLWTCAALPQEHRTTGQANLQLLWRDGGNSPPCVLFTVNESLTTCFPSKPTANPLIQAEPHKTVSTNLIRRDPRFVRPLPWSNPDGQQFYAFGKPLLLLHGSLLAVALVVIPAYFVHHIAWRRRFSLGILVLLPVAFGLAIIMWQVPIERTPAQSPTTMKMTVTLVMLPALVGCALLGKSMAKGRWKWLNTVLAVWLVGTLLAGGAWLYFNWKQADASEYYVWDRWWKLLIVTTYSASALVTVAWLLALVSEKAFGKIQQSECRPAVFRSRG